MSRADTDEQAGALIAHDPAWRSTRAWLTLLIVTALGAAFDLVSKTVAFRSVADQPVRLERGEVLEALRHASVNSLIPHHDAVVFMPKMLEFRLVLNPGAVFGVGPGGRWFFISFTFLALGFGLWIFAKWTQRRATWVHVAIGLVLGGGLGNLYDRVTIGCVRDFLHPLPDVLLPFGLAWPGGATEVWPWVSNVADALLLLGIAALATGLWRGHDEPSPPQHPSGDATELTENE